jgi:hypothetical protein
MKRLALLMVVVALAFVAAAVPAYGQSAVTDSYGGHGGGILGAVNSGGGGNGSPPAPAQVQTASGGSLPFTGLDIGLLALGGSALVGVGIGLRRIARPFN